MNMKKTLLLFLVIFSAFSVKADFLGELNAYASEQTWKKSAIKPEITREKLIEAIEMARCYYLNHQYPAGNFIYTVNIANGERLQKDNQVRQAGALWGLSCLNRDRFNEPTRRALILGIDFFASKIDTLKSGQKCFVYPNDENIITGAVALYCLALTDFLVGQEKFLPAKDIKHVRELLETHISFLRSLELPDGSWARGYNIVDDMADTEPSPYYDGETLLAYCKAARYLGYEQLIPRINESLPKLIEKYTVKAWQPDGNDEVSKSFYQWGCMSFAEYTEAGWTPQRKLVENAAYALTWWLMYEGKILHRTGNTGYAVEGIIGAWRIAKENGNTEYQKTFADLAIQIMANIMTFQYKGPFMEFNPFLSSLQNVPPGNEGGICGSKTDPFVRIDTVQHQTHAMLLMLQHLFPRK